MVYMNLIEYFAPFLVISSRLELGFAFLVLENCQTVTCETGLAMIYSPLLSSLRIFGPRSFKPYDELRLNPYTATEAVWIVFRAR